MNQSATKATKDLITNAPCKKWILVYRLKNGQIALANFEKRQITYHEFAKPIEQVYTCGKYVAFFCSKTMYVANVFSQQTLLSLKDGKFGGFLSTNSFFTFLNLSTIQVYSIDKAEKVKTAYKIAYSGTLKQAVQAGACVAMIHGEQVDDGSAYYHLSVMSVFWREKVLHSWKGSDMYHVQASNHVLLYQQGFNIAYLRHIQTKNVTTTTEGVSFATHYALHKGGFLICSKKASDLRMIDETGTELWKITVPVQIMTIVILDTQYFMIQSQYDWFIHNVETGLQEYIAKCPDWTSGYNSNLACAFATTCAPLLFSKLPTKFCDIKFL